MLFNSLNFIIFLFAVVVIYYLLPRNSWRKVFLLGASYYFYACNGVKLLNYGDDVRFQKPEYFQDASHMNDTGAKEFTKEIAGVLNILTY